jgi:hypothetical protein
VLLESPGDIAITGLVRANSWDEHGDLDAGSVTIRGATVLVEGQIDASSLSSGSGGSILLTSASDVTIAGSAKADSSFGVGGSVTIQGGTLVEGSTVTLSDGALIQVVARGSPDSGQILIESPRLVVGVGATVIGEALGAGDEGGGSVEILGDRVEVHGDDAHGFGAIFAFSPAGAELRIEAEELVVDRGVVGRPIPTQLLAPDEEDPTRFVLVPVGAAWRAGTWSSTWIGWS